MGVSENGIREVLEAEDEDDHLERFGSLVGTGSDANARMDSIRRRWIGGDKRSRSFSALRSMTT